MRSRFAFRIVSPLAFAALAFGASPVATISSSGTFQLHGASVKTEGIPSWPVMTGDEIRTDSTSAVIQFRDGSTVTLSDQSVARVEKSGKMLGFRLLNGSMQVVSAKEPAVQFYNNTQSVDTKAGTPVRVSTNAAKPGHFAPALPPVPKPPPQISGQ